MRLAAHRNSALRYFRSNLQPMDRIACFLIALAVNTVCSAQPGVFTVGIAQDSMATFLVGDTVQAPWQSSDTFTFDPDNDGIIDLLVQSFHYVGGLGSGRRLQVICGDSVLLATTTAIDSVDILFGGPDTVPVPQQFALGEMTTGNELFTDASYLNNIAYANNPGVYTNNMHAWNTVVDGYLVFRKVEVGGVHYGWLRIDTYGPQSSYAVVKEVGYQALALSVTTTVDRSAMAIAGDVLLVNTDEAGTVSIVDAAGRAMLERAIPAGSAERLSMAHLPSGAYCAVLRSVHGGAVLRFARLGQ